MVSLSYLFYTRWMSLSNLEKRVWNLDDSRDESKTVKENDFIENLVIGFFATILVAF